MAQALITQPLQVSAGGSPGTAFISLNTRARASTGTLGLVTDLMQFSGPLVAGSWTLGNQRVKVAGVPTVGMASVGIATGAAGATGPVTVLQGDPRVRGS